MGSSPPFGPGDGPKFFCHTLTLSSIRQSPRPKSGDRGFGEPPTDPSPGQKEGPLVDSN